MVRWEVLVGTSDQGLDDFFFHRFKNSVHLQSVRRIPNVVQSSFHYVKAEHLWKMLIHFIMWKRWFTSLVKRRERKKKNRKIRTNYARENHQAIAHLNYSEFKNTSLVPKIIDPLSLSLNFALCRCDKRLTNRFSCLSSYGCRDAHGLFSYRCTDDVSTLNKVADVLTTLWRPLCIYT